MRKDNVADIQGRDNDWATINIGKNTLTKERIPIISLGNGRDATHFMFNQTIDSATAMSSQQIFWGAEETLMLMAQYATTERRAVKDGGSSKQRRRSVAPYIVARHGAVFSGLRRQRRLSADQHVDLYLFVDG